MIARRLWWLIAGFLIWSSGLIVLYALHALGCALAWPQGGLRLGLLLALGCHLLAFAALAWTGRAIWDDRQSETRRFLGVTAWWSTLAALAATLGSLAPPVVLSTCV